MENVIDFLYLYSNPITRIVIRGKEVLIEKIHSHLWKLSVPIFQTPRFLEKEIEASLSALYQLKRVLEKNDKGKLEIDTMLGVFYWVQYVCPGKLGKDLPFFLKEAQKWAQFFQLK